ncbi:collagen triple helix repeat-containing protein 1-like [Xenia sp. Carnegie-2017]|uniref:collagen triple helix repeat-containing protein 1-like n=1 Tax=Xenia sp. Carnegie-2017 TaxID=2897299 RepID=UPI001F0471E8|nr:collagen triple helix repeat-containing protein 1-like [Xenia sp. Carnegie-2017]
MDCFHLLVLLLVWQISSIDMSKVNKDNCSTSCCGTTGIPGVPGVPGVPGAPGRDGVKGDAGSPGEKGNPGKSNLKSTKGEKGDPGSTGLQGIKGEKGESDAHANDEIFLSTWKQCAWRRDDAKDHGLIQNCVFTKKFDNTSLQVFYGGNLRIHGCNSCCKRWYFTFNGVECKNPLPIDGVFYMANGKSQDIHRHRHIEGYCNKIHKGKVQVGFWVGNCPGYGNADAYSGWNSVSRIVIKEVPPPQE